MVFLNSKFQILKKIDIKKIKQQLHVAEIIKKYQEITKKKISKTLKKKKYLEMQYVLFATQEKNINVVAEK